MTEKNTKYPAPWNLSGEGYIMLFHFSREFVEKNGFLFDALKGKFMGGFGLVILADYKKSDIGPYRELLFIPGQFKMGVKDYYSITKVFTSTEESLESGKANWGIQKELAHFEIENLEDSTQKFSLTKDSEEIASFVFKSYNPKFPLSTRFIPNTGFAQIFENKLFVNKIMGTGKAKFASLKDFSVNPSFFVDTKGIKLWATVRVDEFNMQFCEGMVEEFSL